MAEDIGSKEPSAPRRLCYWRDPENSTFDGFPPEKVADPEARYRYERAQAETQFRTRFDGLDEVPHSRNDLLIACNLESSISVFLHHALIAFADLLLDKRTPGTEALRAFSQHANELLTETFNSKWLSGLRQFELTEDGSSEKKFWDVQNETVEHTRREFEKLLWESELEEATAPEKAGEVESREPTVVQGVSELPGAVTGEKANRTERRAAVDAYIEEVFIQKGKRITRTDIWKHARYKSRTEFERWERNDHRATKAATERFTRILTEKPHLK
jgi:hypothetical protein